MGTFEVSENLEDDEKATENPINETTYSVEIQNIFYHQIKKHEDASNRLENELLLVVYSTTECNQLHKIFGH